MKLAELIAKILGLKDVPEEVTAEQLAEAETKARESFAAAKEAGNFEDARSAVESVKAIVTARTEREASATKLAEDMAALEAEIAVSDPEPEPELEPEPETEPEPTPEPEVVQPEVGVEPEKVDVAASVDSKAVAAEVVAALDARKPAPAPAKPTPTPTPTPIPDPAPVLASITAGGDVQGHSAGAPMSPAELGQVFVATSEAVILGRHGARKSVALIHRSDYPTDRSLSENESTSTNTERINNAVAEAQERTSKLLASIRASGDMAEIEELTAEGGLCAPVNVRYEIFTVGSTARPLRDSFTRFGATRGGIRFNAPPTLATITDASPNGIQLTTEEQDTSGSEYPKDCAVVGCGQDTEVALDAGSLCMIVGNYNRLFYPENFQAWWGLGQVAFARTLETKVWDRMEALSTAVTAVTPADELSAVPDILATVDRAIAQYRWRHRIAPTTPLRLRTQAWVQDYMRADLARRQPGDSTLAVSNAQLAQYFAARNVAVTYALDANSPGGVSGDVQAAGALNPWPDVVELNISIDGTLLYLDGPTLNFGTEIRDFDMIRDNNSGAFLEEFLEVALVGPAPVHIRIDTCPRGMTAGQNDSYDPCPEGS